MHAESCNTHNHLRTEEWKQTPTKAVTEAQYIRCCHERSVHQEREFHLYDIINFHPSELIWC